MKIRKSISNFNPQTWKTDLLSSYGISDIDTWKQAGLNQIQSPKVYVNIDLAVSILANAIKSKSKAGIVCDCDCDGVCSATVAYKFLTSQSITPIIYFHTAKQHGLSKEIMSQIQQSDIDLLIIPDAGSNDTEQCRELYEQGVKILIADHHNIEVNNPYACIVNCVMGEANSNLSGTGVMVKVVERYCDVYNIDKPSYNDLVALSLISDSCDMRSIENKAYFNLVFGGDALE